MQQSRTRRSGKNTIVKIVLAALMSLLGLSVVGVGEAYGAAPLVKTIVNSTQFVGATGSANGGDTLTITGAAIGAATSVTFNGVPGTILTNTNTKITVVDPPARASAVVSVVVTVAGISSTAFTPGADQFTYTWIAGPLVASVSPTNGTIAGGTSVTLAGSSLGGTSAVMFGAVPAASYVINTGGTSITAVSPASTGTTNITVITGYNLGTTSPATPSNLFSFVTTPTVTGVRTLSNPASGPTGGGTQVTIDGTGFSSGSTVKFGAVAAASVLVNSLDSITAISPAGTGTVDVAVHTSLGDSAVSAADHFTYNGNLTLALGYASYNSGLSTSIGLAANPTVVQTFNALTLVTGGGDFTSPTVSVVTQPAAGGGTVTVSGTQVRYTPAQATPTSVGTGDTAVWTYNTTTAGTQTATIAICQTGSTYPSAGCAITDMSYLEAITGFYMGEQLSAGPAVASVVLDAGAGAIYPKAPVVTGTVFPTVTAPPMALIPSASAGFTVNNAGLYQAITPVPDGLTLVPGSLAVSGGDAATSGKYIVSLCTAAMGYVAGQCTARFDGNYKATYPYIETSLNSATTIPGGSQLSLPTISAQWAVTAAGGSTISTYQTEFATSTTVASLGSLLLDAYPTDEASYLNQGRDAPIPTYAPPLPRYSVTVTSAGPAPVVTGVSPTTGPTAGGTSVTITGTDLTSASAVHFGSASATNVTPVSATSVTATAPAGTGTVDVTVTTSNGTSAISVNDQYIYADAPTVTSLSPNAGKTSGGDTVTITGANLTSASAVHFGSASATNVTPVSATSVTATAPAGAAGTVHVTVTTPNGTSTASVSDQYLYTDLPAVTGVSPPSGPAGGGTLVTITGANLTGATGVNFDSAAATGFSLVDATHVTATAPAGTGTVQVTVTTPNGTSTTSVNDLFTYVPAPTVSSISTHQGPAAGGTSVTVTGTNLTDTTVVNFGMASATNVAVVNATQVTATIPAGVATGSPVDVTVTTPGGTSATSANARYTYLYLPEVSSVSPNYGPTAGGGQVSVFGLHLTDTTAVKFGATSATGIMVVSDTEISVTVPAGAAGVANVTAVTPGGTSLVSVPNTNYLYVAAPTVTSLSPTKGPLAGGNSVVITGTGFSNVSDVSFGGSVATYTVDSSTQITALAPLGTGTVNVSVTNLGGSSATGAGNAYTYADAPVVTGVSPSSGPIAGGTTVTITGSNMTAASAVKFGTTNATNFNVDSATQITATAPAHAAGLVDVVVTNTAGDSPPVPGDGYTYIGVPTVTAVSPASGPVAGGTSVTITGTNLLAASAVKFGVTNATSYNVDSDTQITVTAPAGAAGLTNVTVTTIGGTSATSAVDQYTYAGIPTVSGVSPSAGPLSGGNPVTITGTNLAAATAVDFGGHAATGCGANTATSITCNAPSGVVGQVDVTVTTAGGASATTAGDQYTYEVAPNAPTGVNAVAGVTSAAVSWTAPVGGTQVGSYTVTPSPSGTPVTVDGSTTTTTVSGLTAGVLYTFTVSSTNPGGSTSSAPSASVLPVAVAPSSTDSGNGSDPSASTTSGTTTVTASATGSGTVTVSTYPSNPVAAFSAGSAYFDVAISAGSTFTAVSFKVCGLSTGQGVSWWNPAAQAWQTVSNFTAVGSDGCSTVTVGATTRPNLTQMGGTVFASTSAGMNGYWLVASDGGVFAYGDATFYGSMGGKTLNKPIVDMMSTADGQGYWLVASDGGIFAFGDATFYGSTGGKTLNKPIVGMTATADGLGYWLVASDGGVFAYGDAAFYGSTGGKTLNKPIVCMTATPDGKGYWLVAADGGIFAYGDAVFYGSTGGKTLNKPIVCMSTTADGLGYWLVASDGGIFAYGDAVFYGSMGGKTLNKPIVHMAATPDGLGYWLVAADGGVFSYGDATFYGSTGGTTLNKPIVAIAN